MKRLADRLAALRGQAPIASDYRGRIAYEEGRFGDANRLWDGLNETFGQWDPYPFPMDHWRMRYGRAEAIQLEQARTLLALGRRDAAEEILARLPDQLPKIPDLVSGGRTRDALADAGFETAEIGQNPFAGGYHDDVLRGDQRATAGAPVEGEHSLPIDVLRAREHGLSGLTQSVALDAATHKAGALEFKVQSRAEGIETLRIVACRWDDTSKRVVEVASTDVDLSDGEWTPGELEVELPGDVDVVRLFLYYPGLAGALIWFDDARTFAAPIVTTPIVTTPEEWVPRTLAREFPRALLAGGRSLSGETRARGCRVPGSRRIHRRANPGVPPGELVGPSASRNTAM